MSKRKRRSSPAAHSTNCRPVLFLRPCACPPKVVSFTYPPKSHLRIESHAPTSQTERKGKKPRIVERQSNITRLSLIEPSPRNRSINRNQRQHFTTKTTARTKESQQPLERPSGASWRFSPPLRHMLAIPGSKTTPHRPLTNNKPSAAQTLKRKNPLPFSSAI